MPPTLEDAIRHELQKAQGVSGRFRPLLPVEAAFATIQGANQFYGSKAAWCNNRALRAHVKTTGKRVWLELREAVDVTLKDITTEYSDQRTDQ